jgi:hypothetical protein
MVYDANVIAQNMNNPKPESVSKISQLVVLAKLKKILLNNISIEKLSQESDTPYFEGIKWLNEHSMFGLHNQIRILYRVQSDPSETFVSNLSAVDESFKKQSTYKIFIAAAVITIHRTVELG